MLCKRELRSRKHATQVVHTTPQPTSDNFSPGVCGCCSTNSSSSSMCRSPSGPRLPVCNNRHSTRSSSSRPCTRTPHHAHIEPRNQAHGDHTLIRRLPRLSLAARFVSTQIYVKHTAPAMRGSGGAGRPPPHADRGGTPATHAYVSPPAYKTVYRSSDNQA